MTEDWTEYIAHGKNRGDDCDVFIFRYKDDTEAILMIEGMCVILTPHDFKIVCKHLQGVKCDLSRVKLYLDICHPVNRNEAEEYIKKVCRHD